MLASLNKEISSVDDLFLGLFQNLGNLRVLHFFLNFFLDEAGYSTESRLQYLGHLEHNFAISSSLSTTTEIIGLFQYSQESRISAYCA